MKQQNYFFTIVELGGQVSKEDRIRKLVPIFENHRFLLPHRLLFMDYENKSRDLVVEFINDEFLAFPVSEHDDMLDCAARIVDSNFNAYFPQLITKNTLFDSDLQYAYPSARDHTHKLNYSNTDNYDPYKL